MSKDNPKNPRRDTDGVKSAHRKRFNSIIMSDYIAIYLNKGGFSDYYKKKAEGNDRAIMYLVERYMDLADNADNDQTKLSAVNAITSKLVANADTQFKAESDEQISLNTSASDAAKSVMAQIKANKAARLGTARDSADAVGSAIIFKGSASVSDAPVSDLKASEYPEKAVEDVAMDLRTYPNEIFAKLEGSSNSLEGKLDGSSNGPANDINEHLALPSGGLFGDTDGFSETLQGSSQDSPIDSDGSVKANEASQNSPKADDEQ